MHNLNLALFIAFAAFQLLDIWSTQYGLKNGLGDEDNRILAIVMRKIGVLPALILVKVFALLPPAIFWHFNLSTPLTIYLTAMFLFYAWVCWNNLRIIRRK